MNTDQHKFRYDVGRTKMINTLLIANRGEIACRIMRTAKEMGITSVAVYSDVDRQAQHVLQADIAIGLGGAKPADSYLLVDKILAAAQDRKSTRLNSSHVRIS